jgi:hypothetical protein
MIWHQYHFICVQVDSHAFPGSPALWEWAHIYLQMFHGLLWYLSACFYALAIDSHSLYRVSSSFCRWLQCCS